MIITPTIKTQKITIIITILMTKIIMVLFVLFTTKIIMVLYGLFITTSLVYALIKMKISIRDQYSMEYRMIYQ